MSSESTTSEESTTSSREGQEDDAISSNSSEDGENHVICPKSRNKSHQPALSVNELFIYYAINLNTFKYYTKFFNCCF